jgi:hypothetical protein
MYLSENFSISTSPGSPKWRCRIKRRPVQEERRKPENSHFRKRVDALWNLIHALDESWTTDVFCHLANPEEVQQRIAAYDRAVVAMHYSLVKVQWLLLPSTANANAKAELPVSLKKLDILLGHTG